jgi:CBS domain-containing protein
LSGGGRTAVPKAFDFSNPPFDRLSGRELERFKASLDVAFFRSGETIVRAGEVPQSFFIVIKGVVQEMAGAEIVAVHGPNECFDTSLLVERKCRHDFIVEEEAICYLLPVDELIDLTANNKAFAEFFFRDISLKLEALAARQTISALRPVMTARVRDAYIHPPLYVEAAASIVEAARLMKANKATSLLVRDGERVGIVTGIDMREAVILNRAPVEAPVGPIASYDLVTIEADDFLFEGLLSMTRKGVRRLVVRDGEEIRGVLEQVDLLSFLSSQSYIIGLQIDRASSQEELRTASRQLATLVQVLYGQGTKIRFVTQLVAELNRRIAAKLFAMVAPAELIANACLIVMGSEGRGDQVLRTDQDNGMVLRDGFEHPDLERVAQAFTEGLIDLGYPPCPGGVMVSNPAWCRPLAAWREQLRDWLITPDEAALMNVAIFYDAAPVAGDAALLAAAKRYLFELAGEDKAFCARFARAIESFDVPIGIFSHLIVEKGTHKDQLDIKKGGIFPVVHGIRSLALEAGLEETNTVERIRRLEALGRFDRAFATDLIEAYSFLLGLRLQAHLARLKIEQPLDNFIRPYDLNKFERDLLKDALSIVSKLRELVRYHFNLKLF